MIIAHAARVPHEPKLLRLGDMPPTPRALRRARTAAIVVGVIVGVVALRLYAIYTPDRPAAPWVYKSIDGRELRVLLTQPDPARFPGERPALLMFHGGGWRTGTPNQFGYLASDLAGRGVAVASVQYRLQDTHGATPLDALIDAADAMRWIHRHADELDIDLERIGAGGASAGGQLAAALATVTQPDLLGLADAEALNASPRPAALVLFDPVYDNSPEGYGNDRLGERWRGVSPLHNLHAGMPPTLTMLGEDDHLVPVATAEAFRDGMRGLGVRSDLVVYPDQPHGFYDFRLPGEVLPNPLYAQTRRDVFDFLLSLGWIDDN